MTFAETASLPSPGKTRSTASAYERLREMVLSGVLPGGMVLQERRLAEELGFSRTPVREALHRLEGEGLLRRQDRFLTVASVTIAEVMEILTVRQYLETEAARSAAGRVAPRRIAEIRRAIEGMADAEAVSDDTHWATDDLLHVTVAEASGNHLLVRLITELRQSTRLFGLRRIPARFSLGKAEHLAILEALAQGDGETAAHRMRQHLVNARQAILSTLTPGAA